MTTRSIRFGALVPDPPSPEPKPINRLSGLGARARRRATYEGTHWGIDAEVADIKAETDSIPKYATKLSDLPDSIDLSKHIKTIDIKDHVSAQQVADAYLKHISMPVFNFTFEPKLVTPPSHPDCRSTVPLDLKGMDFGQLDKVSAQHIADAELKAGLKPVTIELKGVYDYAALERIGSGIANTKPMVPNGEGLFTGEPQVVSVAMRGSVGSLCTYIIGFAMPTGVREILVKATDETSARTEATRRFRDSLR